MAKKGKESTIYLQLQSYSSAETDEMLKKIQLSLSTRLSSLWLKKHPTFVFCCKIKVFQNTYERRYRVTVVQTGQSFLEGEEYAEAVVRQWIDENRNEIDSEPELKWLTGRPIVMTGLELESDAVRRLLAKMRRDRTQRAFAIEAISSGNNDDSSGYRDSMRVDETHSAPSRRR